MHEFVRLLILLTVAEVIECEEPFGICFELFGVA